MVQFNSQEERDEYKILFAKFIYYYRISVNKRTSLHDCLKTTEDYLNKTHLLRLTKEDLLNESYEFQIAKWKAGHYIFIREYQERHKIYKKKTN